MRDPAMGTPTSSCFFAADSLSDFVAKFFTLSFPNVWAKTVAYLLIFPVLNPTHAFAVTIHQEPAVIGESCVKLTYMLNE